MEPLDRQHNRLPGHTDDPAISFRLALIDGTTVSSDMLLFMYLFIFLQVLRIKLRHFTHEASALPLSYTPSLWVIFK